MILPILNSQWGSIPRYTHVMRHVCCYSPKKIESIVLVCTDGCRNQPFAVEIWSHRPAEFTTGHKNWIKYSRSAETFCTSRWPIFYSGFGWGSWWGHCLHQLGPERSASQERLQGRNPTQIHYLGPRHCTQSGRRRLPDTYNTLSQHFATQRSILVLQIHLGPWNSSLLVAAVLLRILHPDAPQPHPQQRFIEEKVRMVWQHLAIYTRTSDGTYMGLLLLPSCQASSRWRQRARWSFLDHTLPARWTESFPHICRPIHCLDLDWTTSVLLQEAQTWACLQVCRMRAGVVPVHLPCSPQELSPHPLCSNHSFDSDACRSNGWQLRSTCSCWRRWPRFRLPI